MGPLVLHPKKTTKTLARPGQAHSSACSLQTEGLLRFPGIEQAGWDFLVWPLLPCALSFTSLTSDTGPGTSGPSSEITELEIISPLMERSLWQVDSESVLYNAIALDCPKAAVKVQRLSLPCFTEDEAEAQRGTVICPRSPAGGRPSWDSGQGAAERSCVPRSPRAALRRK